MKVLNSNIKNFDKNLDSLLLQRKKKVQSNSVSVSSIIKDVKKNGDKALVKYEKRFNKNTIIIPSPKQITNSIKSLDKRLNKRALDTKKSILERLKKSEFELSYAEKFDVVLENNDLFKTKNEAFRIVSEFIKSK